MSSDALPFWERPEIVERFAGRDPDLRLVELIGHEGDPARLRVLDLGCAGGRNTEFLVRRGCDVYALDASGGMVARTRERVAPLLGRPEAERRVLQGTMIDLSGFPDESFDLIVALGILHNALDAETWNRALAETSRILKRNGRILVADFAPGTEIEGEVPRPDPDRPHLFSVREGDRHYLVDAKEHDRAFARHGLRPVEPTRTVVRESEHGRHVTVNASYVKG